MPRRSRRPAARRPSFAPASASRAATVLPSSAPSLPRPVAAAAFTGRPPCSPDPELCDADGLFRGFVLPPAHAAAIWRLSWLSLAAGLFGLARGHVDLAAAPLAVFATSLAYWAEPRPAGWRRAADLIAVQLGLAYQSLRALRAEHGALYFAVLAAGMACFPLGMLLHRAQVRAGRGAGHRASWASTALHGLVHVLGNVANVVLYSGDV